MHFYIIEISRCSKKLKCAAKAGTSTYNPTFSKATHSNACKANQQANTFQQTICSLFLLFSLCV